MHRGLGQDKGEAAEVREKIWHLFDHIRGDCKKTIEDGFGQFYFINVAF